MAFTPLSTIEGYWSTVANWVQNIGGFKPLIQKFDRQQSVLTTTPLASSGTYTSSTFDTLALPQINFVSAHCYADQPGNLYLDVSMDGTNWNTTQCSTPLNANISANTGWQQVLDRYFRIRYVNSTVTQTVFRLSMTAHD